MFKQSERNIRRLMKNAVQFFLPIGKATSENIAKGVFSSEEVEELPAENEVGF